MAVQHLHQNQNKMDQEIPNNRTQQPPDIAMHSSSSSTMEVGRDNRGLCRPMVSQYPPPVLKTVVSEHPEPRHDYGPEARYENELTGGAHKFLPNAKIAQIPAFDAARFTSWRRELCFWKDLRDYLPERQLISFVGLNGGTVIRAKVMRLFKETVAKPEERTFVNLLTLLDRDFALSAREKDMQQIDRLFEYRREEGESIQGFWAKFDLLLSHLEGSSTCLSDELLFIRSLRSMNLSYGQRTSLLAMLDCRAFPHTVTNLRM